MYAIIEVGAKQYNVKKGDCIEVERIAGLKDDEVTFDKVLLISKDKKVEIGTPYVKDAKVVAAVQGPTKGPKLVCFKYRRRKSSHWSKGHRQHLLALKITEITL